MGEVVDEEFCRQLPKLELHAHLNGSISDDIMRQLMQLKPENNGMKASNAVMECASTMAQGFEIFKLIHRVVDNCEAVAMVTKAVIGEFESDQVKYLELRSTPRDIAATGMTKRMYIEAVLSAIKEYRYENGENMHVRYLPSIDRGRSVADALETVKLAQEYFVSSDQTIPAIDFSGNPYSLEAHDFLPPLLAARKSGLKLAVHMAEVSGRKEETSKLLSLPPDRIGHGTFITDDCKLAGHVRDAAIPIEICVSSNMKTNTSPPNVVDHHVNFWLKQQHPCVICTDDKGVFATDLSNEYHLVCNGLGLTKQQALRLSRQAIDYSFADSHTKKDLYKIFDAAQHTFS